MSRIFTRLRGRFSGDLGATTSEYAIMAALIAVVIVAAVTLLGVNVNALFQNAANLIP